jgi:hypothetical protein
MHQHLNTKKFKTEDISLLQYDVVRTILVGMHDPEDDGTGILRNVGNYSRNDTV